MAVYVAQAPDPKAPKNLKEEVQALLDLDLNDLSQDDIFDLIDVVITLKDERIPVDIDRLNIAADSLEKFPQERQSACEMRNEALGLETNIRKLGNLWGRLNQRWGELEREKKRKVS